MVIYINNLHLYVITYLSAVPKLYEPLRKKTNTFDSDQVLHNPGSTVTEEG